MHISSDSAVSLSPPFLFRLSFNFSFLYLTFTLLRSKCISKFKTRAPLSVSLHWFLPRAALPQIASRERKMILHQHLTPRCSSRERRRRKKQRREEEDEGKEGRSNLTGQLTAGPAVASVAILRASGEAIEAWQEPWGNRRAIHHSSALGWINWAF